MTPNNLIHYTTRLISLKPIILIFRSVKYTWAREHVVHVGCVDA